MMQHTNAGFRNHRHRDHDAWWTSPLCGCTSTDPLAQVGFLVRDDEATERHGSYVYDCLACGTKGVTWQRERLP